MVDYVWWVFYVRGEFVWSWEKCLIKSNVFVMVVKIKDLVDLKCYDSLGVF